MAQFEAEIERKLSVAAGSGQAKKPEPLVTTMDEIAPEKIEWLWENRIPIGRLTLIDGDPGVGKSWCTLAIAADVTTGVALPGGQKSTPANALLLSIEDGLADTIRPRLDQLGAKVSRVVVPNPKRGLPTTMLNASFIEQAVKQVGPKLLIIDPIIAFVGRKNPEKANETRELLSPLIAIADHYGLACIIVRHFTKQVDARAIYRGSGSVDFMAAVRSAFIIVESEEDPSARILAHVKNSGGQKSPSLAFHIDSNGFRWGNEINSDAEELLAANRGETRKRDRGQLDAATKFLEEVLAAGPLPSNKVKDKAEQAGIAWRTVWRAKENLKVKAAKNAVRASGSGDCHESTLPFYHSENLGSLGNLGEHGNLTMYVIYAISLSRLVGIVVSLCSFRNARLRA